jgi:hypothetical protein
MRERGASKEDSRIRQPPR